MSDHAVTACPECDSTQIQARQRVPDREKWLCRECRATFGDPVRRLAESGNTRSGLAKVLVEADPGEVSR